MRKLAILSALLLCLPALAAAPLPGSSLYHLADRWTDQDGAEISLSSLRGQPVVLAMAYTHCREMCPIAVLSMQRVEQEWLRRSAQPVRFAFFSLDWIGDSPAQLKKYAEAHGLDEAHWRLYQGQEAAVRDLAAALGIGFLREANGDIRHAYAVSVLDADGVLVYQQTGFQADEGEILAKLAELTAKRN